jgi:membrane dipeptidase
VGADYVGIGTDITEGRVPQEMANINRRPDVWGTFPWHMCIEDVSQFPEFAQGLVARGYSDNEILKILGENFMRVFAKVWK